MNKMKFRKKRSKSSQSKKMETRVSTSEQYVNGRWRDPNSQPNSSVLNKILRIAFRWTGGSIYSTDAIKEITDIIILCRCDRFVVPRSKKNFGSPNSQPGSIVLSDLSRIIFNWTRGDLYSTEALDMIGNIVARGQFFEDILKSNGWKKER